MNAIGTGRWWAMGAMTLGVLAVGLDGTILSVALPTLATSLHASETDLQWFTSGYLLVLAAAMLPAGLLGDRYGRKRVMLAALALFGVGSIACAASPSPGAFIAARVVLGGAGAGVIVMALSALPVLFSEKERPRAVSIWAAANFLAFPIGPILGGWLLTNFWWGWVFLMNVPVAALGLLAVTALVPESRASERPDLDPVGMAISTTGLVAMTYGLIQAGSDGWGDVRALGPIFLGLAVLAAFFLWERRLGSQPGGQPLVDLALFRSASFTWSVILVAVGVVSMIGVLFLMPQYFQGVLGLDAQTSGVRLLPLVLGLVVGVVPADRLAAKVGAKITVALGFVILGAGLTVAATMSLDTGAGLVAAWMAIVGLGMGLAFATTAAAALSELSPERSGIGSAVLQAVNKLGGPFGAAVLGSALNSAYQDRLHLAGLPPAAAHGIRNSVFTGDAVAHQLHSATLLRSVHEAFLHGMDVAFIVSVGIALIGLLLTLIFLPSKSGDRATVDAERAQSGHEIVA